MHGVDLLGGKALEEPLFHHHFAAAAAFLGRLEHDIGGAGEVARLREIARGAEQHRRMAVVAAGVHAALVLRLVREGVQLLHRQAVHVGAQRNAFPVGPALDHAHHTGLLQVGRHDGRGAALLEGELRMSVQVAPDVGELALVRADALDGIGHVGRRRRRGSTA
jgi:hypothetical protein